MTTVVILAGELWHVDCLRQRPDLGTLVDDGRRWHLQAPGVDPSASTVDIEPVDMKDMP